MAIVKKGTTAIGSMVAAIMAFFFTWFGVDSNPADTTPPPSKSSPTQQSTGFRIPSSMTSAYAFMHQSTASWVSTMLKFKASIMNKSHAEINRMMNQSFLEAKRAKDAKDMQALLRSTSRLMVLSEALRDRIVIVERRRK